MTRDALPPRRGHLTQKAKIGKHRTLYLSVDSETDPREVFLRVKGKADGEKVVCYDTIARLLSFALQAGLSIEDLAKVLYKTQDDTRGAVQGDARIKFCGGTLDYIGQHLLLNFAGWDDLAPPAHTPEGALDHGKSKDPENAEAGDSEIEEGEDR